MNREQQMGKANRDSMASQCCRKFGLVTNAKREDHIHQGRFIGLSVFALLCYIGIVLLCTLIYINQKHYMYSCQEDGKLVSEFDDDYILGLCKCKKQQYYSGEMNLVRNVSKLYCPVSDTNKHYFENVFPLCMTSSDSRIRSCSFDGVYFSCIVINHKDTKLQCTTDVLVIQYNCESLGICSPTGTYYSMRNSLTSSGALSYGSIQWNVTVSEIPVSCCGFAEEDGSESFITLISYIGGALAITHFAIKQLAELFVRKQVCRWDRLQIQPMLDVNPVRDPSDSGEYTDAP